MRQPRRGAARCQAAVQCPLNEGAADPGPHGRVGVELLERVLEVVVARELVALRRGLEPIEQRLRVRDRDPVADLDRDRHRLTGGAALLEQRVELRLAVGLRQHDDVVTVVSSVEPDGVRLGPERGLDVVEAEAGLLLELRDQQRGAREVTGELCHLLPLIGGEVGVDVHERDRGSWRDAGAVRQRPAASSAAAARRGNDGRQQSARPEPPHLISRNAVPFVTFPL